MCGTCAPGAPCPPSWVWSSYGNTGNSSLGLSMQPYRSRGFSPPPCLLVSLPPLLLVSLTPCLLTLSASVCLNEGPKWEDVSHDVAPEEPGDPDLPTEGLQLQVLRCAPCCPRPAFRHQVGVSWDCWEDRPDVVASPSGKFFDTPPLSRLRNQNLGIQSRGRGSVKTKRCLGEREFSGFPEGDAPSHDRVHLSLLYHTLTRISCPLLC